MFSIIHQKRGCSFRFLGKAWLTSSFLRILQFLARFIDFSLRDTHTQNALFLGLIHLKQRHPWYATIRSRRFISNRFVLSKGFYFYPDTLRGFFCPLPFLSKWAVYLQICISQACELYQSRSFSIYRQCNAIYQNDATPRNSAWAKCN